MAGYIGKSQGVTQVDGYTRSEADAEYANIAGDTFTGAVTGTDLTLSGGVYLGGTGSANYLDDYEEGVWTPTVEGATTAGSCTYTLRAAIYVKTGSLVTVYGRVSFSGHTGTGQLRVTGVPFVNNGGTDAPASVGYWNYGVLNSGYNVAPMIQNSASYIAYWQYASNGGSGTPISVSGGGTFTFGATYRSN